MLCPAIQYAQELNDIFPTIAFDEHYKYWHCSRYVNLALTIDVNTWERIQMVSIEKGKLIGYLSANVHRESNTISSLSFLKLDKNLNSHEFTHDMNRFVNYLLESQRFHKISFNVVIGNPAERMYDLMIRRYGGQIIGIARQDIILSDGKYYDRKFYEILREDYLEKRKNRD